MPAGPLFSQLLLHGADLRIHRSRLVAAVIDHEQGGYAHGALAERVLVHFEQDRQDRVEVPLDNRPLRGQIMLEPAFPKDPFDIGDVLRKA